MAKKVIKTKPVEKAKQSQSAKPATTKAATTKSAASSNKASKPASAKTAARNSVGSKSAKRINPEKSNSNNVEVTFWHDDNKSAKTVYDNMNRTLYRGPSGELIKRTSDTKMDKTKKTVAMRRK